MQSPACVIANGLIYCILLLLWTFASIKLFGCDNVSAPVSLLYVVLLICKSFKLCPAHRLTDFRCFPRGRVQAVPGISGDIHRESQSKDFEMFFPIPSLSLAKENLHFLVRSQIFRRQAIQSRHCFDLRHTDLLK